VSENQTLEEWLLVNGRLRDQKIKHECPLGTSALVWAGACALAAERHPNADYPQPSDVHDAQVVAAAIGIRDGEITDPR
jgi:hypothetical protein